MRIRWLASVAIGSDAATGKSFLYVAGNTGSPNVPVTPNATQPTPDGSGGAAYIAKLDPSASEANSLIYLSYFGAVNGVSAIAADTSGQCLSNGIHQFRFLPTGSTTRDRPGFSAVGIPNQTKYRWQRHPSSARTLALAGPMELSPKPMPAQLP